MAIDASAVFLDARRFRIHAQVRREGMAPAHFQQRCKRVLADGIARRGRFTIDDAGGRAFQVGMVVGGAQADAKGIVATAEPPFIRQLGQVQLQIGIRRGRARHGLAIDDGFARQGGRVGFVVAVVVERQAMAVADQQVRFYAGNCGVSRLRFGRVDAAKLRVGADIDARIGGKGAY
ncbi:hypothetical protein D3C72_1842990 [compost metagenome]